MNIIKSIALFSAVLFSFSKSSSAQVELPPQNHTISNIEYSGQCFAALKNLENHSDFQVTFSQNFPEEMRTAFLYAIGIWEHYIISPIPIRINASYTSLASNVLASAGTSKVFRNFGGYSVSNMWYPVALAEFLSKKNINGNEYEINININERIRWSTRTDGSIRPASYDLATVVLHEIAHGLGLSSSFKLDETNSSVITFGTQGLPHIYDYNIINLNQKRLVFDFKNSSSTLLNEVQSNSAYFLLSHPQLANKIKLYAPYAFANGGSLSHIDEDPSIENTPDALMTPEIRVGEVIHQVGNQTLGMLSQIGWAVNFPEELILGDEPSNHAMTFPNPFKNYLLVKNALLDQIRMVDILGKTYPVIGQQIGNNTIQLYVQNLKEGQYFLQIQHPQKTETFKIIKL